MKRSLSGIMVILLITSMLALAFNIRLVRASSTIYIRADGSIDPPTANIASADNLTYYLTGNILDKSIEVERDNIVIDGASYTLQSADYLTGRGIYLDGTSNVTVRNMKIRYFDFGVYIGDFSQYNKIVGNNMTNNLHGVYLLNSSYNTIARNNISTNFYIIGYPTPHCSNIYLFMSSHNTISRNTMTMNNIGLKACNSSDYNVISGNNITSALVGIYFANCSLNHVYHNNFFDNDNAALCFNSTNLWDYDYPVGGNYWSDYTGTDIYNGPFQNEPGSDGIGDLPYIMDSGNSDRYPLISPWSMQRELVTTINLEETSSSNTTTFETVWVSNATLQNAVISGDFRGFLNFTSFAGFEIKTGPFSGRGCVQGNWTAKVENIRFDGALQAFALFNSLNRSYSLKGVITGDFEGIAEGTVTESVPNSGLYDSFYGLWKLNQIASEFAPGTIELNGTVDYTNSSLFPSTMLLVFQATMNGSASGYYSGPLSAVITNVEIDQNATRLGEGFSIISYDSRMGSGVGWTVDSSQTSNATKLAGVFSDPISSFAALVMSNATAPRTLNGTITRVLDYDFELQLTPDLEIRIWGPERVSPGQTVDYLLEYRNLGLSTARNVLVFSSLDPTFEYLSGSEGISYDNFTHTVSWNLSDVAPKSCGYLDARLYVPWALPQGTTLNLSASIVSIESEETTGSERVMQSENGVFVNGVGAYDPWYWPGWAHRKREQAKCKAYSASRGLQWIQAFQGPRWRDANDITAAYSGVATSTNRLSDVKGEFKAAHAFSGGTTVVISAILEGKLKVKDKIVLISPFWFDPDGWRVIDRIREKCPVAIIEIWQSPNDRLPGGFWQHRQIKVPKDEAETRSWLELKGSNQGHFDLFVAANNENKSRTTFSIGSTVDTAHDPNIKYGPPRFVSADQTLNYTVEYENEGEGTAFGVYITDTLDETFNASTLTIGNNGVYNPSTRTITWLIGEVGSHENGTVGYYVELDKDVSIGTEIVNYAIVHFPSVPETTRTNSVVNVVAHSHDVAVLSVSSSESLVERGLPILVNATVENQGVNTESFNVSCYANTTVIQTENVTLASGEYATLSFHYNSSNLLEGFYNISVHAWPVSGETEVVDNTLFGECVLVGTHDIAIGEAVFAKDIVGEGYYTPVNVTCGNLGYFSETFTIIVYANESIIFMESFTMEPDSQNELTLICETTGLAKGYYLISFYAWPVAGENSLDDNTLTGHELLVTIPGDVQGDKDVDIFDIVLMAGGYGTKPPNPKYNPNCDIEGDGDIDIYDIVIAAGNYGESW